MPRYFLHISYLGRSFHGWQRQENASSIQEEVETALATILRQEKVSITGCGRTDTGVHARQYFAHVDMSYDNYLDLVFKLNGLLHDDIAIHEVIAVEEDAHARFDASSREYIYSMHVGKRPFEQLSSVSLHRELDISAMNEAGALLLNYTDFTSFSKVHTDVKTNNCDVRHAAWTEKDSRYEFKISADRFLRNMVRAIVGTMLEVGKGKMSLEQFKKVIEAKDRSAAGASAPAHGLALSRVEYPYLVRP